MTNEIRYFCAGVGLGVAASFLHTPKAGAETRKQIQNKANQGVEHLKEQAANVASAAADVLDRSANPDSSSWLCSPIGSTNVQNSSAL